jgi:hypothetical protein
MSNLHYRLFLGIMLYPSAKVMPLPQRISIFHTLEHSGQSRREVLI